MALTFQPKPKNLKLQFRRSISSYTESNRKQQKRRAQTLLLSKWTKQAFSSFDFDFEGTRKLRSVCIAVDRSSIKNWITKDSPELKELEKFARFSRK